MSSRTDGRSPRDLRPLSCQWDIAGNAAGSVLLRCGKTEVICTATVEESVPRWMKEKNVAGGWLTAEYSMLPASTHDRKPRDSARGKVDGRSTELQRLLGRLRGKEAGLGMEVVAPGQLREFKVVAGLAPPGTRAGLTHGRGCTQRACACTPRQWGEGESAMACQRHRSRASTSSPTKALRN